MKLFSALILALILSACTSTQHGDFVGRWSMDMAATDPGTAHTPANALGVESTIEFTSGGKFTAYAKTGKHDKGDIGEGTYTVSGNKITTTIEGRDNVMNYEIKNGELYLSDEGDSRVVVYKKM